MRSIPWRLWALAISSSALQIVVFPLAGPVPLWRRLFCWICLVPLLAALLDSDKLGNRLNPIQSASIGYVSGICWYLGNCYWIFETMHLYGNIPVVLSFGILVLFSLYVGLYHALFGLIFGFVRQHHSRQAALYSVPFLWVAVELARGRITGFPWDFLGYTQVDDLLLARLAPLTGVMGLSFIVAGANALWLVKPPIKTSRLAMYSGPAGAFVIVVVSCFLTLSGKRLPNLNTTHRAVLVQENLRVGAEAIGPPETRDDMLTAFTQLSLQPTISAAMVKQPDGPGSKIPDLQKVDLIVWPEAPTSFFDPDPAFRKALTSLSKTSGAPVIVNSESLAGATTEGRSLLYNSASFFKSDGSYGGRYDKMHLVPFGEYTPYKPLFFFVGHLLDDLLFVPGRTRNNFTVDGREYGVFICYESIFGTEIRNFVNNGAQVLVNISDDGWYGDTSAPFEHLDMVRMRAIENGRWVLRATNTGVTGAIDPLGRVVATIPRHQRESIEVSFDYENSKTLYTRYGDWFAWVCATVTAALLAVGALKRRVTPNSM
jgi:apolipoprotein N-acyltransferase